MENIFMNLLALLGLCMYWTGHELETYLRVEAEYQDLYKKARIKP